MGLLERALISPRHGAGVCATCFNLTDGYEHCYSCAHGQSVLDAVAAISYSVAGETLHRALSGYKRLPAPLALPLRLELARIARRYLERHEVCLAEASGTPNFDFVTTVPSGDRHRDEKHPLRQLISVALATERARHEPLLRRTAFQTGERAYDFLKYIALRPFDGESVLLVDDTWTTGANAQSAAAALKGAGAGRVAALVIGRYVHREWHENDRRLNALAGNFDWSRCALCAQPSATSAGAGLGDRSGDSVAPGLAVSGQEDVRLERLDRVQ
jgi:predicted amidophosphoribosyltransferase